MNSTRPKIQKVTNNTTSNIDRNTSHKSILAKVASSNRPAHSPSNARFAARQNSSSVLSKDRSSSIKSKSSFKLYAGNREEGKGLKQGTPEDSRKQNVNPNVNRWKGGNVQKGKTVKQVRLGISKQQSNVNKIAESIAKSNSCIKKVAVNEVLNSSSSSQSMLKYIPESIEYIPQSIVEDYKKVSAEDFRILRQTAQFQYSNEYLVVHKRLSLLCTLKKINKNQVAELGLEQQLAESIKIHLYLTQHKIGSSVQKIFMVFNDANSVYIILEPMISSNTKQTVTSSEDQRIGRYFKIVQTLHQLHSQRIIVRNISNSSIKECLGIQKITNFINAAIFSLKKGRQSFMGRLSDAPHQVAIGSDYDSSYDMWSLGLFFYRIVTGLSPFEGEYSMTQIKNLQYDLPISLSSTLSGLISGLLCERERRWSAAQCLKCATFGNSKERGMVCRQIHLFW